ncbi:MAG: TolC family protein [Bdellovibrionota bacterium]
MGDFPTLAPALIEQTKEQTMERKDILALSQQSESLTSLQKANNKFWVPRLSVYGQLQAYNNRNDEFSDWDAYREAYQMGLNLRWNIFDGMTSISKSKQARAQAIAAQNGVRAASLKAGEDAEIWKKKFLYFCKMVDVKTTQTQKAEEAVRLAKESVRAGTKTNSDLIDAELDLFKSRADVLNVRMGMIEALINYQLATGHKVYDFQS